MADPQPNTPPPQFMLTVVVPELRVADVVFNTQQVVLSMRAAAEEKAAPQLVVFPELALSSATCGDLFFQPFLIDECRKALRVVEAETRALGAWALVGLPMQIDGSLYNAAVLLGPRGIDRISLRTDPDQRYFQPAKARKPLTNVEFEGSLVPIVGTEPFTLADFPGTRFEIVIGDRVLPSDDRDVLLNPCARPARAAGHPVGADFSMLSRASTIAVSPAGPGESTTDQVYSGEGAIWHRGKLLAHAEPLRFETQFASAVINPGDPPGEPSPENSRILEDPRLPFVATAVPSAQYRQVIEIQAAGLIGRLRHTGLERVMLGLSGGADSSLALLVCCRAFDSLGLDRKGIISVSMPGPGTSPGSRTRGDQLANLAGVTERNIPIEAAVSAHLADIDQPEGLIDVTFENAQARERTQILMDLANQQGALVVGTGDLSEIALGWSTFNGDQMSMYNVNSGVPKTLLLRVLTWAGEWLLGQEGGQVTREIASAPISPELLPLNQDLQVAQSTEEKLGPYILHDFFLYHTILHHTPPRELFAQAGLVFAGEFRPGYLLTVLRTFYQRFFVNQFKRSASPDGPQVTQISLSPRGGYMLPSDASPALWLAEIDQIQAALKQGQHD